MTRCAVGTSIKIVRDEPIGKSLAALQKPLMRITPSLRFAT